MEVASKMASMQVTNEAVVVAVEVEVEEFHLL